ncbi:MAG TPA: YkgJ family cysteine cluster protein [Candidatus Limivivens merdigallinarum]|uniref:YkgJ family cysteine cluster protein n=1 Tax=Candidatus Limivivens merdigallinarum TaxID=2840859 RepID=A0A9D0ZWE1_9FIRM|nr:YkgJ family cysteine cluster protein [Candidatus Limivivens merdigallinarum]
MKRQVSLEEISDGRLYSLNDLVKADCQGCKGCSDCCRGMGSSIILDPMDIYLMTKNLKVCFEELLNRLVELNVVDGVILPNLKMSGQEEACGFLDSQGRCRIHAFRPGICRLFPLGRYYENGDFRYFLQIHECSKENRLKVKVKNWIHVERPKEYERFVRDWHYFLEEVEEVFTSTGHEELIRKFNLYLTRSFFMAPYQTEEDFYPQFYDRLAKAKEILDPLHETS